MNDLVKAPELPEPDFKFDCDSTPCYYATTVRRLIAEAVEKEREACVLALEPLHQRWRPNIRDRYVVGECAAAIRARGAKT